MPKRIAGILASLACAAVAVGLMGQRPGSSSGAGDARRALEAPKPPAYVESVLASGKKPGYTFVMTVGKPEDSNFTVTEKPVVARGWGCGRFFVDSRGVIRVDHGHPASSEDSAIE